MRRAPQRKYSSWTRSNYWLEICFSPTRSLLWIWYQISASDIDADLLNIAQENARRAGVADTIRFFEHDMLSPLTPFDLENATIITNPPYGKRLTPTDLDAIYKQLILLVAHGRGGFITSYADSPSLVDNTWTSKKLFNGADECIFWTKK